MPHDAPAEPLTAYRVSGSPVAIRPGTRRRDWMDAHPGRHPYKCLPLPAANEFGWDLCLPFALEVAWTGGPGRADLRVRSLDPAWRAEPWVVSNFARGIVTFDAGYLFRTPPGWSLLVQGPPNAVKDGIAPLAGLVETDWLPYTFTMNWQLTRPGTVVFEAGEPFCRLLPVQVEPVRAMVPVIREIGDDPALADQLAAYGAKRAALEAAHAKGAVRSKTHGYYVKGVVPGGEGATRHLVRCDVAAPVAESRILATEEPLLTAEACARLIAAFEAHPGLRGADGPDAYGRPQRFFDDRVVHVADLAPHAPEAAAVVAAACRQIVTIAQEAFGLGPLGADGIQLVVWPEGMSMPEHMDNCHPDPEEAHRTPWREIAVVVYLNDDYEGGHTTFPRHGISVAPRRGHMTAFPADRSHPHAVTEVTHGVRYTMILWLTRDHSKWARPLGPSMGSGTTPGAAPLAP